MWKKLIKWLNGPTPEEAYEAGKKCVIDTLASCKEEDLLSEADHLFNLSSGGFNTTAAHRAFDKGVNDQLMEMGYDAPYTNGQF